MIIDTSAPLRIGLMGGGSDINPYAEKYGGYVLNASINIRQNFLIDTLGEIIPDNSNEFIKKIKKSLGVQGWSIHQTEMGPFIGSGLGSSASAIVALTGAYYKSIGRKLDCFDVASKAWEIENNLGQFCGKQDHHASSFGGVNKFFFWKFDKYTNVVNSDSGKENKVLQSLLLFHTGIARKNKLIQESMKELTEDRKKILDNLKTLVDLSSSAIIEEDIRGFGEIMDKSWMLKKSSNSVSSKEIDIILDKGKSLGAYGGKLCGSGGGGCVLFVVPLEKRNTFIKKIGLRHIDYSIDWNGLDTRII